MSDVVPPALPAAGWYREPGSDRIRYWTGAGWGDYAPVGGVSMPPTRTSTNGFSVAALVLSLLWGYGVFSTLAIIFGAVGMQQTAHSGDAGRGLAIAGFVIGIVGVLLAIVLLALAS